MGLSSLTRYDLFMKSAEQIGRGDTIVSFNDDQEVKNMYYNSAQLLWGLEDKINNGERELQEYQRIFEGDFGS